MNQEDQNCPLKHVDKLNSEKFHFIHDQNDLLHCVPERDPVYLHLRRWNMAFQNLEVKGTCFLAKDRSVSQLLLLIISEQCPARMMWISDIFIICFFFW